MKASGHVVALLAALATPVAAQVSGDVAGQARDALTGRLLQSVVVSADSGRTALTDSAGRYRIRALASGWHRLDAALTGFQAAVRESVLVRGGECQSGAAPSRAP